MNILMKRTLFPFLAALLVLAGCSGANGEEAAEATAREVRVESLVLEPTSFEDIIELTGTVEAIDDATLSAQASGTVERLTDLGTPVQAGEIVALLDDDEAAAAMQQAKAQLQSAQAQLNLAQDTYNRMQPLYQDSVISASEFENVRAQYNQAQASVAQAKASLSQARKRYENTRIRAPFPGTVEEKFIEEGEQVTPGMQVARVVDINPVKIRGNIPERYSGDIERGTPVTAVFKAYSGTQRTGQVSFVGGTIDPQSRTFPVEIQIPNSNRQLKPEMVAQLYITRNTLPNALVVPRSAIVRDEEGTHVYLVEQELRETEAEQDTTVRVARKRAVEIGYTYGERAVLTAGVEPGDEVVVTGQNSLAPGDPVQITQQYDRIPAAATPYGQAASPTVSGSEEYDTESDEIVE